MDKSYKKKMGKFGLIRIFWKLVLIVLPFVILVKSQVDQIVFSPTYNPQERANSDVIRSDEIVGILYVNQLKYIVDQIQMNCRDQRNLVQSYILKHPILEDIAKNMIFFESMIRMSSEFVDELGFVESFNSRDTVTDGLCRILTLRGYINQIYFYFVTDESQETLLHTHWTDQVEKIAQIKLDPKLKDVDYFNNLGEMDMRGLTTFLVQSMTTLTAELFSLEKDSLLVEHMISLKLRTVETLDSGILHELKAKFIEENSIPRISYRIFSILNPPVHQPNRNVLNKDYIIKESIGYDNPRLYEKSLEYLRHFKNAISLTIHQNFHLGNIKKLSIPQLQNIILSSMLGKKTKYSFPLKFPLSCLTLKLALYIKKSAKESILKKKGILSRVKNFFRKVSGRPALPKNLLEAKSIMEFSYMPREKAYLGATMYVEALADDFRKKFVVSGIDNYSYLFMMYYIRSWIEHEASQYKLHFFHHAFEREKGFLGYVTETLVERCKSFETIDLGEMRFIDGSKELMITNRYRQFKVGYESFYKLFALIKSTCDDDDRFSEITNSLYERCSAPSSSHYGLVSQRKQLVIFKGAFSNHLYCLRYQDFLIKQLSKLRFRPGQHILATKVFDSVVSYTYLKTVIIIKHNQVHKGLSCLNMVKLCGTTFCSFNKWRKELRNVVYERSGMIKRVVNRYFPNSSNEIPLTSDKTSTEEPVDKGPKTGAVVVENYE